MITSYECLLIHIFYPTVLNAAGQDPSPISRIESDGRRHYYCAYEYIGFAKRIILTTIFFLLLLLTVPTIDFVSRDDD